MVTKTEIKTMQIPDDVKKYVDMALDYLNQKLETGDFVLELTNDNVKIKVPDINVYIDYKKLYIIYKDIDIVYSEYVAMIKVYKDLYSCPNVYYAHEYWTRLEDLHALAIDKTRDRLKNALIKV